MTRPFRMWCFEDRQAPFVETFRRTAADAGFDVRLTSPAPDKSPAFVEFLQYYQHLSPNSYNFEMACFRRYFEAVRQVGPKERVIIADSDLFINLEPSELPEELMDNGGRVTGSIGILNGVAETDISPHFSFWTGQQLTDFCDFIIEYYKSKFDRVQAVYRTRVQAGNTRASISDMTLFYLWVTDEGIPFFDTNRVLSGTHVDHNVSMIECQNAVFERQFGRKAIFRKGSKLALKTSEGQQVTPAILHLQGRYKIIASDLETRHTFAVAARSAYIMAGRTARGVIAALKT